MRTRLIASAVSLVMAVLLGVIAGPGRPVLSNDPRTPFCGAECFPVSHPWLLIVAAVFAIAGLIGLRTALKGASR